MDDPLTASDITLGILAGGRATRLGGLDKAWLTRDGLPQVLRWHQRFTRETALTMVSANHDVERYARAKLQAVPDRKTGGQGPMAGLEALAAACRTTWMLTLPVDLAGVNDCLLPTLMAGATYNGACAIDDDGLQPLVALWRVAALRDATAMAIATSEMAVHTLLVRLDLAHVRFEGVRFGNLNTAEDLAAAGIHHPD